MRADQTVGCGTGGSCTAGTNAQEAHSDESAHEASLRARRHLGRVPRRSALFNGGSAQSIGGLCNGEPASHTWLDASGQYGPALFDGTDGDDTIIGSDGDDVVCGGAGHNHIHGGEGDDVLLGSSDHDHLDGGAGVDTVVGFGGDDTIAGGSGYDVLLGGPGDDVMISTDQEHHHGGGGGGHAHSGGGHDHGAGGGHDHGSEDGPPPRPESELDEVYGDDGFDICLVSAGDEIRGCEY